MTTPAGTSSAGGRRRPRARRAFALALLIGSVHGAFSLYWGLGGTWLLKTVGAELVESFADKWWLIVVVGVVKIVAAGAPWLLERWGWPLSRVTRFVTWLGAMLLIGWGGLGAVVANVVLAGFVSRPDGYDRDGMIGHAWIWDPLFVVWGLSLVTGLLASGTRRY